MPNLLQSLSQRLSAATTSNRFAKWYQNDGYYVTTCRLSSDDIPQLISLASRWPYLDPASDYRDELVENVSVEEIAVSSWRALADLKAADCVEPLITMLLKSDSSDHYISEEFPHVFGKIGRPALNPLIRVCNDKYASEHARENAAYALRRIAEYHPECRGEVVRHLADMMSKATPEEVRLNTQILIGLVELHAVETAKEIEKAFSRDCLDCGMYGGWEDVQKKMGVKSLGLPMPKRPQNSADRLRLQLGIGIFSKDILFSLVRRDDSAIMNYYEKAIACFLASEQADRVLEQFGTLEWVPRLLEYGIRCRLEIVDAMTIATMLEFCAEYIPRNLPDSPGSAARVIFELTMFWEFLDATFDLPVATSMIGWLRQDGLAQTLQKLNKETNSFENVSPLANMRRELEMSRSDKLAGVGSQRRGTVGRNDPCPCGSGRKYKKCCL